MRRKEGKNQLKRRIKILEDRAERKQKDENRKNITAKRIQVRRERKRKY